MKKIDYILILLMTLTLLVSCDQDWLQEPSDKSLVVPVTIEDFQAILDNTSAMNFLPSLGEQSSDDFFITDATYVSLSSPVERNSYIWSSDDDFYGGATSSDWYTLYNMIFYSNVALEGVIPIPSTSTNIDALNNVKGSALFYRALGHYHAIQLFSVPYNKQTSTNAPGIPLRLNSDVNIPVERASVQECWDQIISDLKVAIPLLPDLVLIKTRPSSAAALALLSRVYLDIGLYTEALQQSNKCLSVYGELIDYNSLDTLATNPFSRFNQEVLFDAMLLNTSILRVNNALINHELYKQFDQNDLRRSLFFNSESDGNYSFGGSYIGRQQLTGRLFGGLATDEVYLIRSEAKVRTGDIQGAIDDLNFLLEKRYKVDRFEPLQVGSEEDVLNTIITERRKELLFRGIRFIDLRRLNQDPRFALTLNRQLSNKIYELPPNDPRYALPIPDDVIAISGIAQNPR